MKTKVDVKVTDELQGMVETFANHCGLRAINLETESKDKKNAIGLSATKRNKISLHYYDKDGRYNAIKEGAESTIKNALETMYVGCRIHDDPFTKRCEKLGGEIVLKSSWGHTNHSDPMCRFLDADDKPPEGLDWIKQTKAQRDYSSNLSNIVRIDASWSPFGRGFSSDYSGSPTNIYAWVFDRGKSARGTWESIRTDEMTFTEWINAKEWKLTKDDLWYDSLPEEERDKIRWNDNDKYEYVAERGFLSEEGDSFQTADSRREDIISFLVKNRRSHQYHDWENAYRSPEVKSLLKELSNKKKEVKEKGDEEMAEFLSNIQWKIDFDIVPWASPNVAYKSDKMRKRYLKASPFPEMEAIEKDLKKAKELADDIDDPDVREYFKDDLNWKDFDKSKRALRRVDRKISAEKQFSKDIPKLRGQLDDASGLIKVFDDVLEEFGEDDARVEKFEKWAEQREAERKK